MRETPQPSDYTDAELALGLSVQSELNSTIRPLLNVDAGDVMITSVHDHHVTLELLGGCSRCLLSAGCISYSVLSRLDERFAADGATFEVVNAPVSNNPVLIGPAQPGHSPASERAATQSQRPDRTSRGDTQERTPRRLEYRQ
ncbi:NifU family protein [Amycolatopsis pithecellobii]|uniref:NIF system FeS cluster assembly NifU C-terminal domain-containing protein n=1 Tax=Amycolatopsis pithecellobii TaxID=664692 RepID=A0A6N7Z5B7_9PSEU|nr:NifU family protein [Amycolatopsis pithecellobii]MTD57443.1 hypothetical protein [Amycolatopsis pithecellobii]